jgi:hypothetical protein
MRDLFGWQWGCHAQAFSVKGLIGAMVLHVFMIGFAF